MSSYYAKNPRYGANIKYYIKESEASLRSKRIARESFRGANLDVVETLVMTGYDNPRGLISEDIDDVAENSGLSKNEIKEVISIVRNNLKTGVNIAFPGWEQLDAEINEDYAKAIIIIKDSNGNKVEEISRPLRRGVNEVNWDLTKDIVTTINSGSSYSSGLSRWVEPGNYTLELYKGVKGDLTKISESSSLVVERIKTGTLTNPESDKHNEYYDMLADLYKKVNQYRSVFEKSNERVKSYKTMVKYISGNRIEMEKNIAALAETQNNLYSKLYGNKSKKEVGEKEPQSIFDRLSNARGGWYSSSYGPTTLHMKSFDIAKEMFNRIKPEMDAYFENVEKVGKILEEAGAPIVLD